MGERLFYAAIDIAFIKELIVSDETFKHPGNMVPSNSRHTGHR